MPRPFVKSATISGNVMELTVELDHPDSGSYVEVSGSATQTGGAFANFYDIKQATSGLTDPNGPYPTVNVSANPLPPNKFRADEDVTFVIRISRVWLTVLGSQGSTSTSDTTGQGTQAGEGTTWDQVRRQSHITDDSSGGPDGAPAAGAGQ